MPVNNLITVRKGTDVAWSGANPVLASGELGYDLTNQILKIGNGVTPWNSLSNHKHSVSDITNFNSAVSGLLPTISNSGDNRLLTSTGSSVGINAESNLTFDSSTNTLNIGSSGSNLESTLNLYFNNIDSLRSNINFKDQFNNTQLYISSNADDAQSYIESPNYSLNINGPNLNGIQLGNNGALWIYAINNAEGVTINNSNFGISNQIADTIAAFSGINKHIVSLPTGTYPSLTELSYVKGATSNIQTQLNNKASGLHTHTSSAITDFNSSVSGLIPVKHIVSGTDISVTNVSGIYTINSTVNTVAESASLITTVFNKTGSPIPKMTAVYIDGGQGDTPTVALAIATGDPTSAGTYGLTFESIPNMSTGKVVVFGALTGLNTDQFNPTAPTGDVNGRVLYLSPSVSGALTLTKPSAPNHIVALGTIVRTHQNEGVIEVRVQNGFELEELHNVAISGVTNGQFLQYNGSGLWVPSSSGNFSTLLVNGTGVSLVGHSHSSSDISNFNSSVSGLLPVTDIVGGNNITVSQSGTIYTVAVTGSLGLTTEEVDDRVSNLLVAGSGISLNYDDSLNSLTVAVSGLSNTINIGNGSGNVISFSTSETLNVVGSGSTTVAYNDTTNTINIGSPSLIREYELVNSTKSTFTVTGGYALNNLDVYHNGIKLLTSGDYTATNGSTFDLIQPAVSGDVVEWLGYSVVPRHQLILGEVRSDTVGNINYLGRAVAGSSEASAVWTIKKYTISDNGIDITTATASNAIWNNRLTETYL